MPERIYPHHPDSAMNCELGRKIREHGKTLARLGAEFGKAKFSYKIRWNSKKEYWKMRIRDFEQHSKKGTEYYGHAYSLMRLISDKESQMFLLHTGRLRQLGQSLVQAMEKARENPSIGNPKERQKSLWSRDAMRQIAQYSNECLRQEKDMSDAFREFCLRHSEILGLSDK